MIFRNYFSKFQAETTYLYGDPSSKNTIAFVFNSGPCMEVSQCLANAPQVGHVFVFLFDPRIVQLLYTLNRSLRRGIKESLRPSVSRGPYDIQFTRVMNNSLCVHMHC